MTERETTPDQKETTDGTGHSEPLESEFASQLHNRRVIVESGHGQRFEGNLEDIHLPDRHVVLSNAKELPSGATYPSVLVSGVDWIVSTTEEGDDDETAST